MGEVPPPADKVFGHTGLQKAFRDQNVFQERFRIVLDQRPPFGLFPIKGP